MTTRTIGINFLIAFTGAILAVFVYTRFENSTSSIAANQPRASVWEASLPDDFNSANLDFTYAAERTVHGVVHVVTSREREQRRIRDPFEFFFGPRERQQDPEPETGFGSGVIVTEDGFIVTNYHVISGADEIQVTLNDQRTFDARVAGTDPNTDIAVLKIDANSLPFIDFGNSDELMLGEWVLAVGNPFGLTSSVTAGIISAKERVLGVLQEGEMPMESFLQTDAAVNVGNSGGALVNLRGELIGIPTLIISPTRTNIGTAFAVPSSIVERVLEDIIEYGEVRRGVLGVSISEITSERAFELDLEEIRGVFVEGTVQGGAADRAGVTQGDVIIEVDGNTVNNPGQLQRAIGHHQPGESVNLSIVRNGQSMYLRAELLSLDQHRDLLRQQEETILGATLRMAPEQQLEELGLPGGVQVIQLDEGTLRETGLREDFIIIAINKVLVNEPSDVLLLLESLSGNVIIEGVYPDGQAAAYTFRHR